MILKPLLRASASPLVLLGLLVPAQAAAQSTPTEEADTAENGEDADTPPVTTAKKNEEDSQDSHVIIVQAIRQSLESAQSIKRNSDAIVDAIVAEDIGKLPDIFASSALQRVAGVTVDRGAGETNNVLVRGLPNLTTTYNGRELFTGNGRSVAIQDFPSGTVSALEVYKSGTADMIEAGIAGEVNVRGRKPFDFSGLEISGSAGIFVFDQSGKTAFNGNLLVSDRWDTGIGEIGVLVNGSFTGLKFLDSVINQSAVFQTGTTTVGGATTQFRYPSSQDQLWQGGYRWRPSVNAAIQWRPTSDLEIYVDGLWQAFRALDDVTSLSTPIAGGAPQFSNVVLRDGSPDLASSLTVTNALNPSGFYADFEGDTNTYQVGTGFNWTHDRLTLSGDVSYTDSKSVLDQLAVFFLMNSSPSRQIEFGTGGLSTPSFEFLDFSATDPANYWGTGLYQLGLNLEGKQKQARLDAEYIVSDTGLIRKLQVGTRYSNRKAGNAFGIAINFDFANPTLLADLPVDIRNVTPGFDFGGDIPVRTIIGIPPSSIRDNIDSLRTLYNAPDGPIYDPVQEFSADETALAGYAQVKYGLNIGAIEVDGLVGLRGVNTKTKMSGFSRITDGAGAITFPPIVAEKEYTDWLPNASARIKFTDQLQLRLAYTETRTRPDFGSLNPSLQLGPPVVIPPTSPCYNNTTTPGCENSNRRVGSQGNPNLDPLNSQNYDASLEYYFSRTGSLTAGIFRRDARGFLSVIPVNVDDPQYGPLRIFQPVNLGQTRIQGAEAAFTSFLDIDNLPNWAKGFGIQLNATYLDAKGDLNSSLAPTVDFKQQRFPGVSKWIYNVVAIYARPVFSARLAYNYRSKYVTFYNLEAIDTSARPTYQNGRGQLDFSASLTPTNNATLTFDIINILANPLRTYRDVDGNGNDYARQTYYLDRTFAVGVRFRF
ncbi:TonB-dependent receptor [Qipengyuania sp.]|uniref:TonB-dependent receptor n=1 Tax=Qipengyuania sp. TaxID=2004515 RepID=UPI003AF95EA0